MPSKVLLIYANEMQPIKGSVFKARVRQKGNAPLGIGYNRFSAGLCVCVLMNCAVIVKFTRPPPPKKKWISVILSAYYSPLLNKNYQQRLWH